jgi:uncharacterized membrane protein (UPF0127 family)/CheY-like chemotaxis protein
VEPDSKPILNLTRGTVVCEHGIIADRALRRLRGLLGRASLAAGEALLLQPAPSIHTAFMRFPIDVIFLDRDLLVVKVVQTLVPWRMASARRAHAALELAAGEAAARGIEIGDRLAVVTVASAGESGWNGEDDQLPMPVDKAADTIHVLLVGKDRRFRSVTSTLLTRRGCAVTHGEQIDAATVRARPEDPDVVVIDAGSSQVAAAREARNLQTLDPPVGVVVVSDAPSSAVPTVPVLAKWGPFDELYAAIKSVRSDRDWRHSNDGR